MKAEESNDIIKPEPASEQNGNAQPKHLPSPVKRDVATTREDFLQQSKFEQNRGINKEEVKLSRIELCASQPFEQEAFHSGDDLKHTSSELTPRKRQHEPGEQCASLSRSKFGQD